MTKEAEKGIRQIARILKGIDEGMTKTFVQ